MDRRSEENAMNSLGNSPASRDVANLLHPFTNVATHPATGPHILSRGQGVYVYDDAGKEYIEGLAGLWCAALGFGERELVAAAVRQLERLPYYHLFAGKSYGPAIDLAEKLKSIAPAEFSKVFFANSGSEANDTAVKMVWYYNNAIGRREKKKIISRLRGYHGVTVAAGSLTGLPYATADFDLPIDRIKHAPCPHYWREGRPGESEEAFADRMAAELDAMIEAEGPQTVAAFVAEPVQGAGGVILPPKGYFQKVQAVLKKHDVLMIADEVICGFGRTGNWWGSQTYGVQPDILTCAKALSSAYLPISAVLISEPIFQALQKNSEKLGLFGHGFTYSGHPVCAAVALRAVQLIEERGLLAHVREVSGRFLTRLHEFAEHPMVGETRGVGLLGGVELCAHKETKRPFEASRRMAARVAAAAQEEGLIVRGLVGDVVAFCPPLIITEKQIDEMFGRFARALARIAGEQQAA
jgi:4-aminobutyrate--pyruvate transaminase